MGLHERLSQCQGPVEGAQTHSHPEGGEEGGFEDQECHDVARPGPDRRQGFFRMGVEVALKAKDVPPVVQPEEEGRDLGDGDLGEGEDPLGAGLVPWRRGRAVLPPQVDRFDAFQGGVQRPIHRREGPPQDPHHLGGALVVGEGGGDAPVSQRPEGEGEGEHGLVSGGRG